VEGKKRKKVEKLWEQGRTLNNKIGGTGFCAQFGTSSKVKIYAENDMKLDCFGLNKIIIHYRYVILK
jgi:hypothetical protein